MKRIEYGIRYQIAQKKKVKTRPHLILTEKSKGSSAFDEQKVKNIAVKYRLQSIFSKPGRVSQLFGARATTFQGMYHNFLGHVPQLFGACATTFRGMSHNFLWDMPHILWHVAYWSQLTRPTPSLVCL